MRSLTVAVWLCVGTAAGALAGPVPSHLPCVLCRIAPAPEIGSGIPVALAIGGVLLAARLLTRWRRS